MIKRIFYLITGLLLLTACSDKYEVNNETLSKATVTFLVSPNGLGDNGYNDVAAEGIFAFAGETGTRLRLLLPENEKEAEAMYRQWLAENAVKDSAVLILGSSAYEQMARQNPTAFTGVGSRVLLFESDAEIAGVSTVIISHYGVSYLAGAMSQNLSALILAAAPGVPSLEESIAGFQAARKLYAGENDGLPCTTKLRYLADGETGFAMPDSAYRYIARLADEYYNYDEMIFPLLGGSEAGLLRFLNDDEFMMALMIGMDTDQAGLSARIPFSVVIRIGDVVKQYLNDWLAGHEWPNRKRLGMKDGAADIVVTPHFSEHLDISDGHYDIPGLFQQLYEQYKDEAIRKEEEYYGK